jgi:hypothetical protein
LRRLIEYFAPLIEIVRTLDQRAAKEREAPEAVDLFRTQLARAVQTVEAACRKDGRPETDIRVARRMVVAWIDQVMGAYPGWGDGMALPPLPEPDGAATGLATIGDGARAREELRELRARLAALGFRPTRPAAEQRPQRSNRRSSSGRSRRRRARPRSARLRSAWPGSAWRRTLQARLGSAARALVSGLRAIERPAFLATLPLPRPGRPPQVVVLAAGLVLLLGLGGFVAAAPHWLQQELEQKVGALECASLDGHLGADRIVRLEGFVGDAADLDRLTAEISVLPLVKDVEASVAVRPWPFCDILKDTLPLVVANQAQDWGGASIRLTEPERPLVEDALIEVEATAPGFDGHLYVFFIRADGSTVPLLPNQVTVDNRHLAGGKVVLGGRDAAFRLRASPPFGTEMLLLIAASEPILSGAPTNFEPDFEPFAAALRAGLARVDDHGGKAAASYLFIETGPV